MTVTPQLVKELREMTLAGMADCKKALDATGGNMDKAVVYLREKGLANAAKKLDRVASEGVVNALVADDKHGFVFEVNCETDFVTKNEGFQKFVEQLKVLIQKSQPQNLEALLALPLDGQSTVQDATRALVATIGENIHVRRYARLGAGDTFLGSYVHAGGKIGVLVELAGSQLTNVAHTQREALLDVAKNVALQTAAMKPQYLTSSQIPADILSAEESIIRKKFTDQGKPEAALAKIIPSSLKSWFKEVCLVDQAFVKDSAQTVAAYVADSGRKLGVPDLHVKAYLALELGQGVEKKNEDFAAEVAATVAAASRS